MNSERLGSAALRNGLLFGGVGAVVFIASAILQDATGTTLALATEGTAFRPLSLLNQATLIIAIVLFFISGWRTGRIDERTSSAALAGFIVALVVGIVDIATIIVNQGFVYRTTILALNQNGRLVESGFQGALFYNSLAGALFTLIVYSALGAGLGFVAGFLPETASPASIVA
jgi:hypothetical protein